MPACAPAKPPCVEISASATTLEVGDTTVVIGSASDIGQPWIFELTIKDAGAAVFAQLVNVPTDRPITVTDASHILEFVSASANAYQRMIVLRARNVGTTEVAFAVDGENYCGIPAGSNNARVISERVSITVNP